MRLLRNLTANLAVAVLARARNRTPIGSGKKTSTPTATRSRPEPAPQREAWSGCDHSTLPVPDRVVAAWELVRIPQMRPERQRLMDALSGSMQGLNGERRQHEIGLN